jgi:FkbM family methyltransferase
MNKLILRLIKSLLRKNLGKAKYAEDYKDFADIAAEGLCFGNDKLINESEINLIHRIGSEIKDQQYVLDVGANTGAYAAYWLKYAKNIVAFEPSINAFLKLEKEFNKQLKVENLALGEQTGEVDLYQEKNDNRLNSLYSRENKNHHWLNTEAVQITTLNEYCKLNHIKDVFFLKIDVEGHELSVLKGASKILRDVKYIQFEFGGAHLDSRVQFRELYQYLKNDFQIYHILKDGIFPINEYHEKLENYRGNNFLAVTKIN